MSQVLLAAIGDAADPSTYSGTPWHAVQAGQALGLIDGGLPLDTTLSAWRWRRLAWNARRLATTGEYGGYQYSEAFLSRLWKRAPVEENATVINLFQLYPERLLERGRGHRWFYIDQTLNQLFETYDPPVGARMADAALAREKAQYEACDGVICFSEWAADDLVATYGLPRAKAPVVIAGANIDRAAMRRWHDQHPDPRIPAEDEAVRLVFVGKEWARKGLDRLLRAFDLARRAGAAVELVVIGIDPKSMPDDLRRVEGVRWEGTIHKGRETLRFLDVVGRCDVGCLLSRAEATGISLREFAALGLATIAPDVGGSPEYVVDGAAELVAPDATDEAIADGIEALASDRQRLEAMKRTAFEAREIASWDGAVRAIGELMRRGAA